MTQYKVMVFLLLFLPGCHSAQFGIEDGQWDAIPIIRRRKVNHVITGTPLLLRVHASQQASRATFGFLLSQKTQPQNASWINMGYGELAFHLGDDPYFDEYLFLAPWQQGKRKKIGAYAQMSTFLKNSNARTFHTEFGLGYLVQPKSQNWQFLARLGFYDKKKSADVKGLAMHAHYVHYRNPRRIFPLISCDAGIYVGMSRTWRTITHTSWAESSAPQGKRENQGHNPGGHFDERNGKKGNPHGHDESGHIDHGDTESHGHDHRRTPKTEPDVKTYSFRKRVKRHHFDWYIDTKVRIVNVKCAAINISPLLAFRYEHSSSLKSNWSTGIGVELWDGRFRAMYSRDWSRHNNVFTFSVQFSFPNK